MACLFRDVEEREEEDPDQVDEVPIDPDQLHVMEVYVPRRLPGHHRDDPDAEDHVQGVQPGRGVVEGPEGVGRDRETMGDLHGPLGGLHHQERRATAEGVPEQARGLLAVASLGRLVCEHREQARRQQYEGVERSDPHVRIGRVAGPGVVGQPVHDVAAEQATEELKNEYVTEKIIEVTKSELS